MIERSLLAPPIPFAPSVETADPGEAETHQALNEVFAGIVTATHEDLGKAERGVHAKSHALLSGELRVEDDLWPELAQGIFAEPGRTYPALIRLSSIAGDPLPDQVQLPRGFALKILGVDGERLPDAEGDVTQDFLFANGPAFGIADAESFLGQLKLLETTTDRVEWAKKALSGVLGPVEKFLEMLGTGSTTLMKLGGYPRRHPLGDRYFTQVPIRFGDYVAKLDLVPASPGFQALAGVELDYAGRADALREEVDRTIRGEGGAFSLRAQLRRNAETDPVEDASVAWPEDDNPYLPVATLTIPAQPGWTAERSRRVDDATSFHPWHGIAAHRPLGNIMRARRAAYPLSAKLRTRLNGCPLHEPKAMPELD
ncbi:catalase family protein [Aurantimonas sp. 22II-16-19i]|uniref:catalase family protein n=1 Tax=Aurantimonas sp. 22II-16-19i TaxID=1317114 RepID=UPI0009F7BE97|nr:catalase family protein [Aurantimonas sp. 22II-16-19i]ORE97276.1 hypothetical protein ATO4_09501 [Aurantimonas sp. 22II-16-19i]